MGRAGQGLCCAVSSCSDKNNSWYLLSDYYVPGNVLNTKNMLLSFNPHNAPSARYHHHFTERKLRHTLPSALERLISKQRTNMSVKDLKTISTKAVSLAGLE